MLDKLEFLETIPPMSLALGAIAFFFVLAFFRGVVQQIAGVLCIAVACIAGWWVYRNGDHLLWGTINELDATWQLGVASLAGFIVYGILRLVAKIMLSLGFGTLISGAFGKREGFGLVGGIVSILPSSVLVLIGASLIRFFGQVEDLGRLQDIVESPAGSTAPKASLIARIADRIDDSPIGGLIASGNPASTHSASALAHLSLLSQDATAWWALSRANDTQPIVTHPEVVEFLRRPEIQTAISTGDHATLLQHESLWETASTPEIRTALKEIALDDLINTALFQSSGSDETPEIRRAQRADLPPSPGQY